MGLKPMMMLEMTSFNVVVFVAVGDAENNRTPPSFSTSKGRNFLSVETAAAVVVVK